MTIRYAPLLTYVQNNHTIEGVVALLQQLLAQNEEIAREIAAMQAKLELLEHKVDTIAEEAGMI